MGAHTTADDPTKYRVSAEVEEWKFRDPILRLKSYLAHEGMADEAYFSAIDVEADRFAAELREGCVTMKTMPGETMWDHVYAEDHPVMEAERSAYLAYKASFEEAN
jgi:pyruvate dehydrogenase E1 component alpha subunit